MHNQITSHPFHGVTLMVLKQIAPFDRNDLEPTIDQMNHILDEAPTPVYLLSCIDPHTLGLGFADVGYIIAVFFRSPANPFRHPNLAGYVSVGAQGMLGTLTEIVLSEMLVKPGIPVVRAASAEVGLEIMREWADGAAWGIN